MEQEREQDRLLRQLRMLLVPSGALAGWIGCAYIFGDPVRTSTPSFGAAQSIAPMQAWGVLFALGAVTIAVAGYCANAKAIAAALFVGGVIYTWWGSLFGVTLATDDHASIVAPVLYLFIGFAHFAGAWRIYTGQP